jgi:uncharacterized protein (DUF4415 family)
LVAHRLFIPPSAKENVVITKPAKSDPDARPFTNRDWDQAKTTISRGRGRPPGNGTKQQVTLRMDSDTLAFYKSKGDGWQTFINLLLGEIKKDPSPSNSLKKWCLGADSNRHALRHRILSPARLPIPSPRQVFAVENCITYS